MGSGFSSKSSLPSDSIKYVKGSTPSTKRPRRPSVPPSSAGSRTEQHPTNFAFDSSPTLLYDSVRLATSPTSSTPTMADSPVHDVSSSIPPPHPFTSRKADIFQVERYKDIDKHACQMPDSLLRQSYNDVAAYLTRNCKSDLQRLRAVFSWLASVDPALLQQRTTDLPDSGTPLDYLLKINWRMGNHAQFMARLSTAAGLKCLVINGINKSAAYQLGERIDRKLMSAQWNAVFIDDQWRLLDVFWASTCLIGRQVNEWYLVDVDGELVGDSEQPSAEVDSSEARGGTVAGGETLHAVNEFFFLTDPDQLITTHLPDDENWQLLAKPISFEQFESAVYIRERFFQLQLKIVDDQLRNALIKCNQGQAAIRLHKSKTDGRGNGPKRNYDFRYQLFRSRRQMASSADQQATSYDRFVFYQNQQDSVFYSIRFPVTGRFKLDIYGLQVGLHDSYDLICSYLIECSKPDANAQPLPDCPDIGWGPNSYTQQAGLTARSHNEAVIETKDGKVDIWFKLDDRFKAVLQNVLNNDLSEWLLSRQAVLHQQNDELVVSLRLAQQGEYALKLFAQLNDKSQPVLPDDLQNVCNYLIRCLDTNSDLQPFPRIHQGVIGENKLASGLGVTAVGDNKDLIKTADRTLRFKFQTKTDDVELFCNVDSNTVDRSALSQCVKRHVTNGQTVFSVELPQHGEYAVNVYCCQKNKPAQLHHVHSYFVTAEPEQSEKDNVKVTDGQRDKSRELDEIEQLTTEGDTITIELKGREHLKGELNRTKSVSDAEITSKTKDGYGGSLTVYLKQCGTYYVDVYDSHDQNGRLDYIKTYAINKRAARLKSTSDNDDGETANMSHQIDRQKEAERAAEKERRAHRNRLKEALTNQNEEDVRRIIEQMRSQGGFSESELQQAEAMLQLMKVSQDLTAAMRVRRLADLERAVSLAEQYRLDKRLGIQLAMARLIIEQLRRIDRLRHDVLNLNQRTIAELRSYIQPPPVVHKVMTAAFLLLGDTEKNLKDWKAVQVLIGKTGKTSLKRRVQEFDVENLSINLALKVKELLSCHELIEVRDSSAGAATFFVWSQGMIEEAESRNCQNVQV